MKKYLHVFIALSVCALLMFCLYGCGSSSSYWGTPVEDPNQVTGPLGITSFTDDDGDNVNPVNETSTINFSVKGYGFEKFVDGCTLTFVNVDTNAVYTATIVRWLDRFISANVNVPGGKYIVRVTRGDALSTPDTTYYYKGTGNYPVTVQ